MNLRDLLGRYPKPDDVAGVRRLTAEQWKGIAARTDTYLESYRDGGSNERGQRRAEWLADLAVWEGIGSVLELGCGAGRNLACLSRRWPGLRVGGVDINPEAVTEARRLLPSGQILCADLYDVLDADLLMKPDAILTCAVLGHLEATAVQDLLRWALARARLLVFVEEPWAPGRNVVAKGPKAWGADKATGSYVLLRHNLVRWLLEAGARAVRSIPVPEDLQAPGATEALIVEGGS